MESLPEELVIKIFSYLSCSNLVSLTLTCKRFSDIINSSCELLDIFAVTFSYANAKAEWIGSRNYSNVMIMDGGVEKFLEIQQSFRIFVKKLKFSGHLEDILIVLRSCPNLKELKIIEASESFKSLDNNSQLHLQLDKLSVDGAGKCLKIFRNSQIKEFHIEAVKIDEASLKMLLQNQKNLTTLKIASDHRFSQNFMSIHPQFKLKKFYFKSCVSINFEKLEKFLAFHKNSLENIELPFFGHRESALLIPFKNLKTVKLNFRYQDYFIPNNGTTILAVLFSGVDGYPSSFYEFISVLPQIEILKISELKNDFVKFSNYFPNVKKLIIDGDGESFFVDAEFFEKLEILEITAENLKNLKIPKSLKKLKLNVKTFHKANVPFNFDGNIIEELIIDGAANSNWIGHLLASKNTHLKNLSILNSNFDETDDRQITVESYHISE